MNSNVDNNEKRQKAIAACLNQFVEKGLYETTSRDLSKALNLQSAGMYSYFSNKDEAVLVCAEEAAFLLEKYLVEYGIKEIKNIDAMCDEIIIRAERLSHMMRFLAQVCSVPKYAEGMKAVLDRLNVRYLAYAERIAEHIGCQPIEIETYFYLFVSAISNYMIFGGKQKLILQIDYIKQALKAFERS